MKILLTRLVLAVAVSGLVGCGPSVDKKGEAKKLVDGILTAPDRASKIEKLRRLGDSGLDALLAETLNCSDDLKRGRLEIVLFQLNSTLATQKLADLAEGADISNRARALRSLAASPQEYVAKREFLKHLADESASARAHAFIGLSRWAKTDPSVRRSLDARYRAAPSNERLFMAVALAGNGIDTGLPLLLASVDNVSEQETLAILGVLGPLGSKRSIKKVHLLAEKGATPRIRQAAKAAEMMILSPVGN